MKTETRELAMFVFIFINAKEIGCDETINARDGAGSFSYNQIRRAKSRSPQNMQYIESFRDTNF